MSKDSTPIDGDRVQGAPASRVVPWSFGGGVPKGWVWVHPDLAHEHLQRLLKSVFPEALERNRLIVETPGGTLTADAETNALREVIEEHAPEEHEGPIPLEKLGSDIAAGRHVVQDLVPDGQLVTIVGEEGEGKSTLGWQIACEVSSGKPVGGHFEVPEQVAPVLIVDVEQTEEDAVILRDDMRTRGLNTEGVFWLDANGREFDKPDDKKWLTHWVRALQPRLIILDTGTEAVTKPREDESVKLLFIALHSYLKNDGVRAVIMLAQPRKRGQDAPTSRRFDDLFGSRVWKGRSSAVLYLQQDRLTVWKQRGGYLRRRWNGTVGRIVRSDTRPTVILGPQTKEDAEADRRATILKTVAAEPGAHSKSSLLEEKLKVSGRDRPEWSSTVEALIREGEIRPEAGTTSCIPPSPPRHRPEIPGGLRAAPTSEQDHAPLRKYTGGRPPEWSDAPRRRVYGGLGRAGTVGGVRTRRLASAETGVRNRVCAD